MTACTNSTMSPAYRAGLSINNQKGLDEKYIFPSPRGGRYWKYNSKHFCAARERAGLAGKINWHSARATFATELRRQGVSEEDRATLLDHSQSVTSHYSVPQVLYMRDLLEGLVGNLPDLRAVDNPAITEESPKHKKGLRQKSM